MYILKYCQKKIKEEMDKLILSSQHRKQVADISPENFEIFLYIDINKKYNRYVSFTRVFICIYVNDLEAIMNNPDVMGNNNILLHNNMIELLVLKY